MIQDSHRWQQPQTVSNQINWEDVYRAELPRVYNFLRYRLQDEQLAEELTAVTFEKAWRNRSKFQRKKAAFRTWLFTIARNVATDHFRRQQHDAELLDSLQSNIPSPEEQVSQRQDLAQLALLLADLPEREREIIALKFGAELTNREIGRQLGLSAMNIGVILFRTLRKLRGAQES